MPYSKYDDPFRLRKPGRPRLPAAQRKSVTVAVRFTKRQLLKLQAEAEDSGITLAELVRTRSLQKRQDDDSLDGLGSLADLGLRSSRRGFLNL